MSIPKKARCSRVFLVSVEELETSTSRRVLQTKGNDRQLVAAYRFLQQNGFLVPFDVLDFNSY